MAFELIITNAGRAAVVNAASSGTDAVTVTQIGLSSAVIVANPALTVLAGEIKRLGTLAGGALSPDKITVQVLDDTTDAYTLRAFALYLNDGTLFALYAQADAILIKTATTLAQLEADIAVADIDATLIEFGDPVFTNPPATESLKGIAEIATQAETDTGTDDERIVTPKKLLSRIMSWISSRLIWSPLNDGSGSGLDADIWRGKTPETFVSELLAAKFPSGTNGLGNWRKVPDGAGGFFIHQWGQNWTGNGFGGGNDGWSVPYAFPIAFTDAGSIHMRVSAQTVNFTGTDSDLIAARPLSNAQYQLGSEDQPRIIYWEAWGK